MKTKINILVVLLLVIIATKANAQTWTQVGNMILGQNAEDYVGLEDNVAISQDGSIIAVASERYDNYRGQVRVFQNVSGQWVQMGNEMNGDTTSDNFGDAIALSANGLIIAVGAPQHAGNGNYSGQVKVFEYDQTTSSWEQIGSDIYGEETDNFCGLALDISNDGYTIAVSSPYNDNAYNDAGQIRVYHYDGTDWVQVGNSIYGENADEKIYYAKLNGDGSILATGSNNNSDYSGFVRVYKLVGNTWTLQGNEIVGEAANDHSSLPSLSDDGLTLAIGGNGSDVTGNNAGSVRIFTFDGTNWHQLGSTLYGEAAEDWFGGSAISLSSNGLRIAVGAFANDDGGDMAGEVKVFDYNGTDWIQVGNDIDGTADNDGLGQSLALSGDGQSLIIGIPRKDDNGYNSGAAVVYHTDVTTSTPNISKKGISIYPNPTTGKFMIYNNERKAYDLELINTKGEKILDSKIFKANLEVNISGQPSGVYFVKMQKGNNVIVKKIVKK